MKFVDSTCFFPYTFMLNMATALVIFNIVHATLKNKYNSLITVTSLVGVSALYSFIIMSIGVQSTVFRIIYFSIYYLIQFCVILSVTKGKIKSKITAIILSLLSNLSGFLIFFIINKLIISTTNLKLKQIYLIYLVCFTLFIYSFSFIFISIIKGFQKTKNKIYKYKAKQEQFNEQFTINELEYKQFLMLKNEREEFRKIRHDLINIMTTAIGFIEIEQYSKALNLLKETSNDLNIDAIVPISESETLNTIYTIKSKEAKKYNAKLNVNVLQYDDINISDYDLCRLINNLIDNSLNAVKSENLDKHIDININVDEKQILINTKNQYSKRRKKEQKNSDKLHGYGQKIIREIAEKYNGDFKIKKEEGYYITNILLNNVTPPRKIE